MADETDHWRNTLRNIAWDAEETGTGLFDALKAFSRAKFVSVGDGTKVLIGAGGQGKNANYMLVPGASPTQATAWASRFLDLYAEANEALVNSGDANPSDDQILTEMLDRLRAVTHAVSDFRSIRDGIPPTDEAVLELR